MRRERTGVLPLRPLCLGKMAAGAKLRAQSSSREQTPLDPAVSPRRVTTLWMDLLSLKMDAPPERREQQERADSPGPSCVSMKSDWSMGIPPNLKDGRPSREESPEQRADSPGPSCVSMKSDWSMGHPPEFKDGRPSREER
ncbi:unnamed protein product [Boreogadus saida]